MPRPDGTPTLAEALGFVSHEAMDAHHEGEQARISHRRSGFFKSPQWPAGTPERDAWEKGWEEAADEEIKPWPMDEDCPGCPGHKDGIKGHPEGAHKMSCSVTKTGLTFSTSFTPSQMDSEFYDPLLGPALDMHRRVPITSHKPGTPGYVPPPPRPLGEPAGIEPPYQETYQRRVKVEDKE